MSVFIDLCRLMHTRAHVETNNTNNNLEMAQNLSNSNPALTLTDANGDTSMDAFSGQPTLTVPANEAAMSGADTGSETLSSTTGAVDDAAADAAAADDGDAAADDAAVDDAAAADNGDAAADAADAATDDVAPSVDVARCQASMTTKKHKGRAVGKGRNVKSGKKSNAAVDRRQRSHPMTRSATTAALFYPPEAGSPSKFVVVRRMPKNVLDVMWGAEEFKKNTARSKSARKENVLAVYEEIWAKDSLRSSEDVRALRGLIMTFDDRNSADEHAKEWQNAVRFCQNAHEVHTTNDDSRVVEGPAAQRLVTLLDNIANEEDNEQFFAGAFNNLREHVVALGPRRRRPPPPAFFGQDRQDRQDCQNDEATVVRRRKRSAPTAAAKTRKVKVLPGHHWTF